jgi:hypothetical protein
MGPLPLDAAADLTDRARLLHFAARNGGATATVQTAAALARALGARVEGRGSSRMAWLLLMRPLSRRRIAFHFDRRSTDLERV